MPAVVGSLPGLTQIADQATRAALRLLGDRVTQVQTDLAATQAAVDRATGLLGDLEQRIATVEQQLRTEGAA